MKFVEKNSILKKINELSPRKEYHGFFLSHEFVFLGSNEFNEFGEWVPSRGWDGTNKNWASQKRLPPGGWGAVRLVR